MKINFSGEHETIEIDGVKMSLELLKSLANPKPSSIYRLIREGDVVTIQGRDFGNAFPVWVNDLFQG